MTLDDAIRHCEEVADYDCYNKDQLECAYDHAQLAQWLTELKEIRGKNEPILVRYEGDGYADGEMIYDYAYCPNCDHEIEVDSENWGCDFCPDCGQRLRWEE